MMRTTRSVLECASPLALSPVSVPARSAGTKAFTLVSTIGALAVIAVLTAVIAPSVVRRVDHATWTRETADLQTIADAYTQYILTNKTIPGTSTWATSVANYMSLPVSAITTNSRRFARAFLVDPAYQIGTNVAGQTYTQTTNGTSKPPVSARVIFVSSLARALPISTGIPSTNEFNAIWDTPEGAKPSTWTSWTGSGDDLRIKRLNLEPLFYQLILVSRGSTNQVQPAFWLDSSDKMLIPSGGLGWNKYYLDGTIVGLGTNDASQGVVRSRQRLKRSTSFVFDSGAWSDSVSLPAFSGTGSDFVNHASVFMNSPNNPYTSVAAGVSQASVLAAMYTFMFDYSLWANECPHFSYHGKGASSVPEYILLNDQGQNNGNVDKFSKNLILVPH